MMNFNVQICISILKAMSSKLTITLQANNHITHEFIRR